MHLSGSRQYLQQQPLWQAAAGHSHPAYMVRMHKLENTKYTYSHNLSFFLLLQ
jgi:hypothetical protein